MKRSDQLYESVRVVQRFRDAYADLVSAHEREPPTVGLELKRKVGQLAGAAHVAAGERDEFIRVDFPIAAGGKVTGFRAIEGWEYPFQPGGSLLVEPEFLLLAYDQIVGAMEEEARQIANREKTLLGRLVRFIGFPIELRENLRQQYPSIAKAGIPAGITVQILVAVTIAVLSTLAVRIVDGAIEAVTSAPASTETPSPAPTQ